ncbi:LEA type 2 family protein [Candidatus Woesearchaeota archaeon]|nr:LEA type 2 family protein [Candidatus Woesearchaeota archaeon]MBW3005164.1 LEA type 2 family protein [Candidatus Woesearchaeota archaeon]
MKKQKRWIVPVVILLILLIAIGGYAAYYFYAFTQLKVTDVKISQFTDFSLKGFSFVGFIDVYNPNLISVKINRIDLSVVFEPTDQKLASGFLQGEKLPAKQVTRIPFQQNISWAPALSLVLQLATSKEPANIVLTGNVFVTDEIKLPFVYKVDIREYFKRYADEYIASQKKSVVEKIEERYGETVGAIAEHVAGYLPKLI